MRKSKWIASNDPAAMLRFLDNRASDRKLRLFAVACCQQAATLFTVPGKMRSPETGKLVGEGLEILAKLAEGLAGENERIAALAKLDRADYFIRSEWMMFTASAVTCALHIGEPRAGQVRVPLGSPDASWPERVAYWVNQACTRQRPLQAHWLRDIFGNPFRPVASEKAWLSTDVLDLVSPIYADHAFDRLPVLADALEDVGCIDADILNHCRQPGEHVRGCWVVDLLLDKK